jgi:hypothetical protein
MSNLCGIPIQYVECDLGESRHVNVVGLAEVYQGLLSAKQDIALDTRLILMIIMYLIFHYLCFKNLSVVHLCKNIVITCAKPLEARDALILIRAPLTFQFRPLELLVLSVIKLILGQINVVWVPY